MRIDQDDAAFRGPRFASTRAGRTRQHQVVNETQHKRRFPASGLGDRQEMTAQQSRRQDDGNAVSLCSDTPMRQPSPSA